MSGKNFLVRLLSIVLVTLFVCGISHATHEDYNIFAQLGLWIGFWFSVDFYGLVKYDEM